MRPRIIQFIRLNEWVRYECSKYNTYNKKIENYRKKTIKLHLIVFRAAIKVKMQPILLRYSSLRYSTVYILHIIPPIEHSIQKGRKTSHFLVTQFTITEYMYKKSSLNKYLVSFPTVASIFAYTFSVYIIFLSFPSAQT